MGDYSVVLLEGDVVNVLKIPAEQTYEWILKKHYAQRLPSISHAFGLYENSLLLGIVTFGVPASPFLCRGICGDEYKHLVLELNRLVITEGVKNGASFIVANAFKHLPQSIVVSYADTAMGHIGYVYQATNWIYTGATKERTDMYAGDGRHSRHNKGQSNIRQPRSSKHRYVYFVKCGKGIKSALKYPVLPYPKGESRRYDASYQPTAQCVMVFG